MATHAGQGFDVYRWQLLCIVEGFHVGDGYGHRLFDLVTQTGAGLVNLLCRYA
ncbi:hypothetical protein D3C76_1475060 [compost metagenome]